MPYIEKLTSALPHGGYRLALTFADGFTALLDPAASCNITVEDGVPVWPCGADIDPAILRIWTEAGRVLSDEETSIAARVEHRTLTQI